MRFYSQNDLIGYWEGGKTYKQMGDEVVSFISDQARTIPYITEKYFQVKKLYDAGKSKRNIMLEMGAEDINQSVKLDTHYKIIMPGGRSEERMGVFLHAFISDCFSLWEEPATS